MKRIALILFFVTAHIFAQQKEPEYYVAELLQTHRAVMLGDMNHHQPVYTQNVIRVLNSWLDLVSRDSAIHNITLILECESNISELLNDTISEKNFHVILNYGDDYVSYLEDIEFYSGLVSVFSRINRLNTVGKHITFKVKGFEEYEVPLNAKTNREGELWFVNVRDSVLGEKILGYMKENPNEKILIFYGGMHLYGGRLNKGLLTDVNNHESEGFMLAYYLKRSFGYNEILTVKPISASTKDNVLINNGQDSLNCDFKWLMTPYAKVEPRHLPSLFGKRFIESSIITVKKLEDYPNGYKAQKKRIAYLNSLEFITGKRFSNSDEIIKWYDTADYNAFDRITSDEFWQQCYSSLINTNESGRIRNELSKMGFYSKILDTLFVPDSALWFGEIRKINTENILFINSIAFLWMGYDTEKLQALDFLHKVTEWKTNDPVDYIKWYRNRYFGVNY